MVSAITRWQARRASRLSRGHEAGVRAYEAAVDYELVTAWCGSGFHTGQITDDDLLRFFSVFEALEDVGMSKPNVEPFHIHAVGGARRNAVAWEGVEPSYPVPADHRSRPRDWCHSSSPRGSCPGPL
jgi:hypothetical protein